MRIRTEAKVDKEMDEQIRQMIEESVLEEDGGGDAGKKKEQFPI